MHLNAGLYFTDAVVILDLKQALISKFIMDPDFMKQRIVHHSKQIPIIRGDIHGWASFCFISRLVLAGFLWFCFNQTTQAQVSMDMAPVPLFYKDPWVLLQQENIEDNTIESSAVISEEPASISISNQYGFFRLWNIYLFQGQTTLDITNETLFAENLYQESHQVESADLPVKLYASGIYATLPIAFEHGSISLLGGHSITTDQKDISEEDYNQQYGITFGWESSDSVWYAGAIQRSVLGSESTLEGLLRYELYLGENFWFVEAEGESWSAGYMGTWGDVLIETRIPYFFTMGIPVSDYFSLMLMSWKPTTYYRLSEEEPWNSAVLRDTQIKSTLSLAWHAWMPLVIHWGMGQLAEHSIKWLDESGKTFAKTNLSDSTFYFMRVELLEEN
ncbi:MAG: hypothetical protein HQM11_05255 [SAR324 cluster bacterium]|nr:hypothetical protein [SAR324 cluster bacterium]